MYILFVGKPGAGKGTIAQRLKDEGFIQLSTGDLLRDEVASGSKLGQEIDGLLKLGKFASDETVLSMVKSYLEKNKDKDVIFDGFPRNLAQAKAITENGIKFDAIIHLNASDELVHERICNRWIHKASGRVYNIKTLPPKVPFKDDETGEDLTQRHDDKPEVIADRLERYRDVTFPVLAFYEKEQKVPTLEIDAGDTPIAKQLEAVKDFLPQKHHQHKHKF
jgi:adenylate kinase